MASSDSRMSIDPKVEAHYADIGKAVVEAAVAQGEQPDDTGKLDVDIDLRLHVRQEVSDVTLGDPPRSPTKDGDKTSSKLGWSIDRGVEAHYADIGKAVVEAAVAQGEQPDDQGKLDVDVDLKLHVNQAEGLKRSGTGGWHLCCVCTQPKGGGHARCVGTCCL